MNIKHSGFGKGSYYMCMGGWSHGETKIMKPSVGHQDTAAATLPEDLTYIRMAGHTYK